MGGLGTGPGMESTGRYPSSFGILVEPQISHSGHGAYGDPILMVDETSHFAWKDMVVVGNHHLQVAMFRYIM